MAIKFPTFRPRPFKPDFPIIQLRTPEDEARRTLESHAEVLEEDADSDRNIARYCLAADDGESRVSVGIWDGRVRFANYLSSQANRTQRQRSKRLSWFLNQYGGIEEFDDPTEAGSMRWCRNPKRKVVILLGLHLGPIRVIDQDIDFWSPHEDAAGD